MKTRAILFFLLFATMGMSKVYSQKSPLYVGTYTAAQESKGIYELEFDSKTADIKYKNVVETSNPSFLARKGKLILAVNELVNGKQALTSFRITENGFKLLNSLPTTGQAPCHVIIEEKNQKYAVVSNYLGGALDLYALNEDGSIKSLDDSVHFKGSSVNKARQEASHVHSAFQGPDQRVYVSDLGTDKIHVLEIVENGHAFKFVEKEIIQTPKGAGPRHLTFHPNGKWLYALMELTGDLVMYKQENGSWKEQQVISMNGPSFTGNNGAADVKITTNGKQVYATNRGEANTITLFKVLKNGELQRDQVVSVLGNGPRNFNFSPDEKFILVGNQNSNEIVVFHRDTKSGLLKDSGKRFSVFKPVCLIF